MTGATIRQESAPALGDIRAMTEGTVYLYPSATERDDWPRYIDALASVIAKGVNVQWVRP